MIMSSKNLDGGGPVRRSHRLQNAGPEYEPFPNPEEKMKKGTPTKPRRTPPRDSIVESDLNHLYDSEPETKLEDPSITSYINGSKQLNHRTNQPIINKPKSCDDPIENPSTQSAHPVLESSIPPLRSVEKIPPHRSVEKTKIILLLVPLLASTFLLTGMFSKGDTEKDLKSLFPEQSDRLWSFVSHGMHDSSPFVLLLVHNGQAELANCLASHIAEKVVWGRTKETINPVILDGKNENSNLLVTLKSQMEKQHALVLQNIEYLHGDVADKLHFILDVHEPWIPGGVYILTLHVPNINDDIRKSYGAIRTFLKDKWLLEDDDLDPLIARISNFEYILNEGTYPC